MLPFPLISYFPYIVFPASRYLCHYLPPHSIFNPSPSSPPLSSLQLCPLNSPLTLSVPYSASFLLASDTVLSFPSQPPPPPPPPILNLLPSFLFHHLHQNRLSLFLRRFGQHSPSSLLCIFVFFPAVIPRVLCVFVPHPSLLISLFFFFYPQSKRFVTCGGGGKVEWLPSGCLVLGVMKEEWKACVLLLLFLCFVL